MIESALKMAFDSIRQQKMRAWLTMLGIFIGIASVTTLISLGDAVNNAIQIQFEMMGGNKIMILPGGDLMSAFLGGTSSLTVDDVETLDRLASVKSTTYYVYQMRKVYSGKQGESVFVMGLSTDTSSDMFTQYQGLEVVKGRKLKEGDKYSIMIGYELWSGTNLYDKPVKVKETLTIDNKDFEVVGLLSSVGNSEDDSSVYIPYETADEMFGKEGSIDFIMAEASPGFGVDKVAEIIKQRLLKEHDLKEGEEDFSVQTSENLIKMVGGIMLLVQLVFVGVAMISLVVGGIGIMNTMYTSVLERTKQIGVMKAVGARDSQILTIFLVESGVYGLVGGLVGALSGFGLAKMMELGIQQKGGSLFTLVVPFNPWLILSVLSFSFVVGVLSGILPARQASKMNPVDALRYE